MLELIYKNHVLKYKDIIFYYIYKVSKKILLDLPQDKLGAEKLENWKIGFKKLIDYAEKY